MGPQENEQVSVSTDKGGPEKQSCGELFKFIPRMDIFTKLQVDKPGPVRYIFQHVTTHLFICMFKNDSRTGKNDCVFVHAKERKENEQ